MRGMDLGQDDNSIHLLLHLRRKSDSRSEVTLHRIEEGYGAPYSVPCKYSAHRTVLLHSFPLQARS